MLPDAILSYITFLPLVGVVILLFIRGRDAASENLSRWVALVVTLLTAPKASAQVQSPLEVGETGVLLKPPSRLRSHVARTNIR